MAQEVSDLKAPVLLLAMPQVLDPFFHRSVVLLLRHSEEGSLGFIANRPTEIRVADILTGMEIGWQGEPSSLAYFGGPVEPQRGSVLFDRKTADFSSSESFEETTTEVNAELRITQHVGDLARLARKPSRHFRFFLGYAGWGEGQLVQEILRNDWLTAPVQEKLLFSDQPAEVWEAALKSVGVDPATLPSWTVDSEEGGTN